MTKENVRLPSTPVVSISIIVPTLNEVENIAKLITRLRQHGGTAVSKIVVVDAGSTDDTVSVARAAGATVVVAPMPSRAAQMNYGASLTESPYLYFVHGDTLPPKEYMPALQKAIQEGYEIGSFRFKFDSNRMLLRLNSFMTRFNRLICRGGDQSLFVKRSLFDTLGGFKPDYVIMEDFDFIKRARKKVPFKVIQKDVLVSARKYTDNPWWRVQYANAVVFNMFQKGHSQAALVATYKRLLKHRSY